MAIKGDLIDEDGTDDSIASCIRVRLPIPTYRMKARTAMIIHCILKSIGGASHLWFWAVPFMAGEVAIHSPPHLWF